MSFMTPPELGAYLDVGECRVAHVAAGRDGGALFDVQVLRGGRWLLHRQMGDFAEAVESARLLTRSGKAVVRAPMVQQLRHWPHGNEHERLDNYAFPTPRSSPARPVRLDAAGLAARIRRAGGGGR